MDTYIINKVQRGHNYMAVNISKHGKTKSERLRGNLPLLFPNMMLQLTVDRANGNNEIVDWKMDLIERNQKVLLENDIDLVDYCRSLNRFNALRKVLPDATWKLAQFEIPDLYTILSFEDADRLHYEMIGNAFDRNRLFGINAAIIQLARADHKISYTAEEYINYFNRLERKSAYGVLPMWAKGLAMSDYKFVLRNGLLCDEELTRKAEEVVNRVTNMRNNAICLLEKHEIDDYVNKHKKALDSDQQKAMYCLESSEPCVITGGGGVGKTTMVDSLIKCYSKYYGKGGCLLVAPTGKAARRLAEKTKMPTSTIHTAVRISPGDEFVGYTPSNPLPYKLVVVDESSMVDTELMYNLLGAIRDGAKIVFVGDHRQLAPVGYGEPFVDFLKTLQVYHLTINHRCSDTTDLLAKAEDAWNEVELTSGRGFGVHHILESEIPSFVKEDDGVQYMSPYNQVNEEINNLLKRGSDAINVGDKVILTRNTKDYCNGDIGIVTGITQGEEIIVKIDGRCVGVDVENRRDIALAYGITVHKMQGSENERVVFFVPENDTFVDRRMMYTAITRSKQDLQIYYYKKTGECA